MRSAFDLRTRSAMIFPEQASDLMSDRTLKATSGCGDARETHGLRLATESPDAGLLLGNVNKELTGVFTPPLSQPAKLAVANPQPSSTDGTSGWR